MYQRLPAPDSRPWCERCGEVCEPGEDAIRTEAVGKARPLVRDYWWHVECHAAELVSLVEETRNRSAVLGVTVPALAGLA